MRKIQEKVKAELEQKFKHKYMIYASAETNCISKGRMVDFLKEVFGET